MAEYIEREALKKRFKLRERWLQEDVHDQYSLGLYHGCATDAELIDEIPAADVVPVVHGRWGKNADDDNIVYCDQCLMPQDMPTNYCHHCGADMRGEQGCTE